jgi:MFS family permease
MLGDGVFTVSLAIETLRVDHSASGLSYVLAARILPGAVLLLVGGVVADRVPRRLTMLLSDSIRCLAVAAIAVLTATDHVDLLALAAMALVFGIADAFFFPAATAITPELVPAELFVAASAMNNTSAQLAQILVGPAIGGLVVSLLGSSWGFGIDAASFALSAACLLLMTRTPRPAPTGQSALNDIVDGLRYCRTHRWLWVGILAAGLGNFVAFSPLGALIPLLIERTLHQGSLALGLVLASGGLGGMIAALTVGHLGAPRHRVAFIWLGWGLSGVGVLGLGLAPDVWAAGAVAFATYGLDAIGNVLWNPLIQQQVPAEKLGRVSSVDYLLSFALSPIGLIAAGATAAAIGVRTTLLIGGAITALTTLTPLIPGIQDPDLRPEPPVSSQVAATPHE